MRSGGLKILSVSMLLSDSSAVNDSSSVDLPVPIDSCSELLAGNSKSTDMASCRGANGGRVCDSALVDKTGLDEWTGFFCFASFSCCFGAKVKLNSRPSGVLGKLFSADCAWLTGLSSVSADPSSKVCLQREHRNAGLVSFTRVSATLYVVLQLGQRTIINRILSEAG